MVDGGSANGERPAAVGPTGEFTEVASAKRAVLGVFRESEDDELEDVRGLTSTFRSFLPSVAVSLEGCCCAFDIVVKRDAEEGRWEGEL